MQRVLAPTQMHVRGSLAGDIGLLGGVFSTLYTNMYYSNPICEYTGRMKHVLAPSSICRAHTRLQSHYQRSHQQLMRTCVLPAVRATRHLQMAHREMPLLPTALPQVGQLERLLLAAKM